MAYPHICNVHCIRRGQVSCSAKAEERKAMYIRFKPLNIWQFNHKRPEIRIVGSPFSLSFYISNFDEREREIGGTPHIDCSFVLVRGVGGGGGGGV